MQHEHHFLSVRFLLLAAMQLAATAQAQQPQIDWLLSQRDPSTGLILSYKDDTTRRSYIFDQALAIIAFTEAGKLTEATNVLKKMAQLQIPNPLGYGAWCECYLNGACETWKYVSGPIAWMVMAVNFYEARTGDTNYARVAERALTHLLAMQDTNTASSTFGAFHWSNWSNEFGIFSTEHSLDAYSAFQYRGLLGSNRVHLATASNTLEYLRKRMWAPSNTWGAVRTEPCFWGGWSNWWTDCSYGGWSVTTDVNAWGMLALGPLGPGGEEFYKSVNWIHTNRFGWGQTICTQDYSAIITDVVGFKCRACVYTPHIHVDFTEHVVAALKRVGDYAAGRCNFLMANECYSNALFFHRQMARTDATNGSLVHSFSWPERNDDELDDRRGYVASTAWHYFNERWVNPFVPALGPVMIRQNCAGCPVAIGWRSLAGKPYRLQYRSTIVSCDEVWHDLLLTNGNGATIWISNIPPAETQRFYRVVLDK